MLFSLFIRTFAPRNPKIQLHMEYRVTVRLSDHFEESKFFPFLNVHGREYRGRMMWWKTDNLDLYSLQRSLEKCEIQWFKVALMPIK